MPVLFSPTASSVQSSPSASARSGPSSPTSSPTTLEGRSISGSGGEDVSPKSGRSAKSDRSIERIDEEGSAPSPSPDSSQSVRRTSSWSKLQTSVSMGAFFSKGKKKKTAPETTPAPAPAEQDEVPAPPGQDQQDGAAAQQAEPAAQPSSQKQPKQDEAQLSAARSAALSDAISAMRSISRENLDFAMAKPATGPGKRVQVEEDYKKAKLAKQMAKLAAKARFNVAAKAKAKAGAAASGGAAGRAPDGGQAQSDSSPVSGGGTGAPYAVTN